MLPSWTGRPSKSLCALVCRAPVRTCSPPSPLPTCRSATAFARNTRSRIVCCLAAAIRHRPLRSPDASACSTSSVCLSAATSRCVRSSDSVASFSVVVIDCDAFRCSGGAILHGAGSPDLLRHPGPFGTLCWWPRPASPVGVGRCYVRRSWRLDTIDARDPAGMETRRGSTPGPAPCRRCGWPCTGLAGSTGGNVRPDRPRPSWAYTAAVTNDVGRFDPSRTGTMPVTDWNLAQIMSQ